MPRWFWILLAVILVLVLPVKVVLFAALVAFVVWAFKGFPLRGRTRSRR